MDRASASPRRFELQRTIGARYDELHALLVRAVHPICFGAFALLVGAIVLAGVGIAFELFDSDVLGIVFAIACVLATAVYAAFTFVFTRGRAITSLVLLAGWTIALFLVDDIDTGLVWAIWSIATLSVLVQLVLLAKATPSRVRGGLVHLLLPATIGTLAGSVPVVLGLLALIDGDPDAALALARIAFIAAGVVVLVLLVLHVVIRRGEPRIVAAFAATHQLEARSLTDEAFRSTSLVGRLMPAWAEATPEYVGTVRGRAASVRSGFSSSRSPDVPSLHLTVLALGTTGSGRDLWVRRRDRAHDNLLVGASHAGVVRFESIALDEGWSIRFAPGTSTLDSFRTFGPQALELLERALGAAQVCRIGDAVIAWVVGGVLDVDELEALAATLDAFATLLEGVTDSPRP